MNESSNQPDDVECDFCGDLRPYSMTYRINNSVLHAKDVLTFCGDRPCQKLYDNGEDIEDLHAFCSWCGDMINVVLHTHMKINGKTYHQECWKRKVRTIEETHNTNPLPTG